MVLGWLTALFSNATDHRLGRVQHPGGAYRSPVEAMAALLDAGFTENEWASFDARDGGGDWVTVQVRGAQVNTLSEPVDLMGVLRAAGFDKLANKTQPADMAEQRRSQAHEIEWHERPVAGTLFSIAGATSAELAEVVNAVFRQHYGFSPMYELIGTRER